MSKKIQITIKQAEEFNRMREALRRIGAVKGEPTTFMTPDQIRREFEKDRILDYEEELGMAYENMQGDAAQSVKGVKKIVIDTPITIHDIIGSDQNL